MMKERMGTGKKAVTDMGLGNNGMKAMKKTEEIYGDDRRFQTCKCSICRPGGDIIGQKRS